MRFREIQELLEQNRFMAGPLPPASLGKGKGSGKDFSKSIIRGIKGPGEGPIRRNTGGGGETPIGSPPTDLPDYLDWIINSNMSPNSGQVQDAIGQILVDMQSFFNSFGIPLDFSPNGGEISDITPRFIGGQWVYDINITSQATGVFGTVTFQWDSVLNRFVMKGTSDLTGLDPQSGGIIEEYLRFIRTALSPDNPAAINFSETVRSIFSDLGFPLSTYNDPVLGPQYLMPLLSPEDRITIIDGLQQEGLLPEWFKPGGLPEGWGYDFSVSPSSTDPPYPVFDIQVTSSSGDVGPPFRYDGISGRFNVPGSPLDSQSGFMSYLFGLSQGYGGAFIKSLENTNISIRSILRRFARMLAS